MVRIISIGFTGTSGHVTRVQENRLDYTFADLRRDRALTLHHGDCIGADKIAHELWKGLGGNVWIHPPTDPKKRAWCKADEEDFINAERPYLDRNMDIAMGCQLLIACPGNMTELPRGSGTWATIRYARKLLKPITIIFPDGSIAHE